MDRRRRRLPALAAAVLLGLAGAALADIVHMKSGQKIEGEVLEQTASTIRVKTKFGTLDLERSKVERIETARLPKEELEHRVEQAGKDPQKLYEAAQYAKEKRLKDEVERILEMVIAVEPLHEKARQDLGHIPHEGQWFRTPEDLERYKALVADKMKAAGKVFYDGKWVNEATAKRLQGLELYEGEWIPHREIYRRQSAKLAPELLGAELKTWDSEQFQLRAPPDFGDENAKELLEMLEKGWAHFGARFRPDEKEENIMGFYPVAVYVLPDPMTVTTFVEPDGYMDRMYNPPKDINDRYVDANSFPIFFPRPLMVTSIGRHLKGAKDQLVSLRGFQSHFLGNLMIRRFRRGGKIPGWIEGGLSHWYEARLNGFRTLTTTEYKGFEHVKKKDDTLLNLPMWYERMSNAEFRAQLPRLDAMRGKPVEELTAFELVKSYFLIDFLLETRPEQLVDYARNAYQGQGQLRRPRPEDEAFREAFGMGPDQLEAEFEDWARSIPMRPPV